MVVFVFMWNCNTHGLSPIVEYFSDRRPTEHPPSTSVLDERNDFGGYDFFSISAICSWTERSSLKVFVEEGLHFHAGSLGGGASGVHPQVAEDLPQLIILKTMKNVL